MEIIRDGYQRILKDFGRLLNKVLESLRSSDPELAELVLSLVLEAYF
jgi:hypothetical protein